ADYEKRTEPSQVAAVHTPSADDYGGAGRTAIRSRTDTRKISLTTLVEYIDWSPFFHTWELRGRYPAIFEDPTVGNQARELFDDANNLLEEIIRDRSMVGRGVHGFWPANRRDDDVDLYRNDDRTEKLATFYFLRQQMQ